MPKFLKLILWKLFTIIQNYSLVSLVVPRSATESRTARRVAAPSAASTFDLSWKVRCRTFIWFFSQMIKRSRAPSPLYRRQCLQENMRWKVRDEIYKIYMLLRRSGHNILAKNRRTFWWFFRIIFSLCSANFAIRILHNFDQHLLENFREMEIWNRHRARLDFQIPREFENLGETGNLKIWIK